MKNLLTAALAALLCSCGGANYTITGRYELTPGEEFNGLPRKLNTA